MKSGQTSSRGGIEDLLFPMQYLNITQGDDVGTHNGTYAIDNAGKDTGSDPIFAPCTMKVMNKWGKDLGNDIFVQSVNKVRLADGSIDYVTFRFIHDNYTGDFEVGRVFAQGEEFSDEGNAGNTNGTHAHIEVGRGEFYSGRESVQNSYGTWHLADNMPIENACFMDGTEILVGIADWKYTKDVPVVVPSAPSNGGSIMSDVPDDFVREVATFTCTVEAITIRSAPSLSGENTGLVYTKGQSVNYEGYVIREGYAWITWISASVSKRRWMAVRVMATNEPWGTFS